MVFCPECDRHFTKKYFPKHKTSTKHRENMRTGADYQVFDIGKKHKGRHFFCVKNDQEYCRWVLELPYEDLQGTIKIFRDYLSQQELQ